MADEVERILETCVYTLRNGTDGPEILMMNRRIDPNKGRWVPLGDVIHTHESPYECMQRRLREFGLELQEARLRGLVTELAPFQHKQWVLFIYVVTQFQGTPVEDTAAGALVWIPVHQLVSLAKPQSDSVFGPHVVNPEGTFFEATMKFDEAHTLVSTQIVSQ